MAERKATNKYYPPDWDPSKGSINKHNKSHPLRARAKKIDQGILVIRFEMPFNVWCLGCDKHIAMGVRYNAEKSKVGNYYSSPIFKFRMKCHLCDTYFEIQTDPAKLDYSIISGARRQKRMLASDEGNISEADQIIIDREASKKLLNDAIFRLEKKVEDKMRSDACLSGIQEMIDWRSRWKDSFSANQLLRSQFRKKRKENDHKQLEDKKLLKKLSLTMPLEPASTRDIREAKLLSVEKAKLKNSILSEQLKCKELLQGDIFVSQRIKRKPIKSELNVTSSGYSKSQLADVSKLKRAQSSSCINFDDSSTIKNS